LVSKALLGRFFAIDSGRKCWSSKLREQPMVWATLSIAAFLTAANTSALAESKIWNVTEEGSSGIKGAQGQWFVNIDSDNKISGTANMQLDTGAILTYTIDGAVKDSVYTIKMSNRTDGKNGCVWSGHIPAGEAMKSHGLIGKAVCDGNVGLTVRAGF
jgi:hypothetical protein